jgi:hypothetical protein
VVDWPGLGGKKSVEGGWATKNVPIAQEIGRSGGSRHAFGAWQNAAGQFWTLEWLG